MSVSQIFLIEAVYEENNPLHYNCPRPLKNETSTEFVSFAKGRVPYGTLQYGSVKLAWYTMTSGFIFCMKAREDEETRRISPQMYMVKIQYST